MDSTDLEHSTSQKVPLDLAALGNKPICNITSGIGKGFQENYRAL